MSNAGETQHRASQEGFPEEWTAEQDPEVAVGYRQMGKGVRGQSTNSEDAQAPSCALKCRQLQSVGYTSGHQP